MSEQVSVKPVAPKGRHGWVAAVIAGLVAGGAAVANNLVNRSASEPPATARAPEATIQAPMVMQTQPPPAATQTDVAALSGLVEGLRKDVQGLAGEVHQIQTERAAEKLEAAKLEAYQRGRADEARERRKR